MLLGIECECEKESGGLQNLQLNRKDIPISMTWNGQTTGYILSTVKPGEALEAKMSKLDDRGNHLFFANELKKFIDGICRAAGDLTGHKSKIDRSK